MGREKGIRLNGTYTAMSVLFDTFSIAVSLFLADLVRHGTEMLVNPLPLLGTWGFYSILALLLSDMESVHHARTAVNRWLLAYRLIRIALIVTVFYVIAAFVFRLPSRWFIHSRLVIGMVFVLWSATAIMLRLMLPSFIVLLSRTGLLRIPEVRILAFGDPAIIARITAMLKKSSLYRRFLRLENCAEP